jgi:hypothetical protein
MPNLPLREALDEELRRKNFNIVDRMGSHLVDGKAKVRGVPSANTDTMYVVTVRRRARGRRQGLPDGGLH